MVDGASWHTACGLTSSHVTSLELLITREHAATTYKSRARVVQRGGRVNVSMRLGCRSQRWLRRYDAPPRPMRPGAAEPSPSVLEGRAHEWGPAPGQCEHSGSMAWRHSQALGQRLVDAERFAGREGHRPWIGAIRSFYRPGAVRVGLSLCILSLVSRCWLLGRRHAGLNYD